MKRIEPVFGDISGADSPVENNHVTKPDYSGCNLYNTEKNKRMGAAPYIILLFSVVSDLLFGGFIAALTLIPYFIYYFINKDHEMRFISTHVRKSFITLMKILIFLFLKAAFVFYLGLGVLNGGFSFLFQAGVLSLFLIVPSIIFYIYALAVLVLGTVEAFKLEWP